MLRFRKIALCLLIISKNILLVSTIFTIGCDIPEFPLIGKGIKKIIQHAQIIKNSCSNNIELVDKNATHIWITDSAFDDFNIRIIKDFFCCYRSFKSENNIENVVYGECIEFNATIKANHAFVRVECYNMDDKIYDGYFVFPIEPLAPVSAIKNGYNVLILGIESVSRLNFHRTMTKTSEYLRQRGSIDFLGYNKVGDNSYPNLFPLLTGHSFNLIKDIQFNNTNDVSKLYPFIWDNFKKAGYFTALGSDSIAGLLGSYEYNFSKIPTDFYLQTFIYEARNIFRNQHYYYHQCLNSKYFYKILLDYIEGLTNSLKYNRLFGMFWEESVSHENVNGPYIMDEDYLKLLTILEENMYLDGTVVIFLSDHGFRWGDIVRTEQGNHEERLPLFQVLLPKDFKQKYKIASRNFIANRKRLITPFDVYHTLLDFVDPSVLVDKHLEGSILPPLSRSSLFLPVSESRTCSSVGIEEHWCACKRGKKLKVSNRARNQAAKFLITHVNKVLESFPQCFPLTVSTILEATMVNIGKTQEYNVVLQTYPGEAVLQGTLIRNGTWNLSGTVSRLDSYGTNRCIIDESVKLYCVCQ